MSTNSNNVNVNITVLEPTYENINALMEKTMAEGGWIRCKINGKTGEETEAAIAQAWDLLKSFDGVKNRCESDPTAYGGMVELDVILQCMEDLKGKLRELLTDLQRIRMFEAGRMRMIPKKNGGNYDGSNGGGSGVAF